MSSAPVFRFKLAGVAGEGAFLPEPDPHAMSLDRQDDEVSAFWQEILYPDLADLTVAAPDGQRPVMARAG